MSRQTSEDLRSESLELSRLGVNACVARSAKCNEVLLGVIAGLTTELLVVDFEVRHRAAQLTPPAVPAQHLLAESFVRHRIKP